MGISKVIGYVLAILGAVIVAIGAVPVFRTDIKIIPAIITNNWIMIVGAVIVIVGIIPIMKTSSKPKVSEVPIYHGKDIVGFRRIGK